MSFYMRAGMVVLAGLFVAGTVGCGPSNAAQSNESAQGSPSASAEAGAPTQTEADTPAAPTESAVREISEAEFDRMKYVSWREGCPGRGELRFVDVPFVNLQGATETGTLVIRADLAKEVGTIFEEIHETGYRIQQIKPIEDVVAEDTNVTDSGADAIALDDESMAENNTSAFNCRELEGEIDQHGMANAIDINPLYNPMITECVEDGTVYFERGCVINPPAGEQYARTKPSDPAGPILWEGHHVVQIFKSHGWRWGGDWNTLDDPQHFDAKNLN